MVHAWYMYLVYVDGICLGLGIRLGIGLGLGLGLTYMYACMRMVVHVCSGVWCMFDICT